MLSFSSTLRSSEGHGALHLSLSWMSVSEFPRGGKREERAVAAAVVSASFSVWASISPALSMPFISHLPPFLLHLFSLSSVYLLLLRLFKYTIRCAAFMLSTPSIRENAQNRQWFINENKQPQAITLYHIVDHCNGDIICNRSCNMLSTEINNDNNHYFAL